MKNYSKKYHGVTICKISEVSRPEGAPLDVIEQSSTRKT